MTLDPLHNSFLDNFTTVCSSTVYFPTQLTFPPKISLLYFPTYHYHPCPHLPFLIPPTSTSPIRTHSLTHPPIHFPKTNPLTHSPIHHHFPKTNLLTHPLTHSLASPPTSPPRDKEPRLGLLTGRLEETH